MRIRLFALMLTSTCLCSANAITSDDALLSNESPVIINSLSHANDDDFNESEESGLSEQGVINARDDSFPIYENNQAEYDASDAIQGNSFEASDGPPTEASLNQGVRQAEEGNIQELPGEEFKFRLKVNRSNHYNVEGKAKSDIGKLMFKSQLLPSNEVKLSLKFKQGDLKDSELKAYFDLANFTMELDGANAVLNKDHKIMMDLVSHHLRQRFQTQFEGYEIPEHALMLVQMLSYWSTAPEGFVYEKREIVSQ